MTARRPRHLTVLRPHAGHCLAPRAEERVPLSPPEAKRQHPCAAPGIIPARMPFQPADHLGLGQIGPNPALRRGPASDHSAAEPVKQSP
jgi:hypothetical protein